jgi:NAD(P)-dependent dehydrogenase (short-subunit alcohol dehydrogenase family)
MAAVRAPLVPAGGALGSTSTGDDAVAVLGEGARGLTMLVTGASSGLGFETARVLASAGATIIVAVLPDLLADTLARLRAAVPAASFDGLPLDLADLASVRAAAAAFCASARPLHVLINNAGVMATPLRASADGYELQFAVNYLGHFAFTTALLPALRASAPARVICISSAAHALLTPAAGLRWDTLGWHATRLAAVYEPWEAYGMSKLCAVLHAAELQRRADAGGWGITTASIHPGAILWTDLKRHVGLLTLLRMLTHAKLWHFVLFSPRPLTKSVAQGVATAVVAALQPAPPPGAYWAECAPLPATDRYVHPLAHDPGAGARLWEVSERLTAPGAQAARA